MLYLPVSKRKTLRIPVDYYYGGEAFVNLLKTRMSFIVLRKELRLKDLVRHTVPAGIWLTLFLLSYLSEHAAG